MDDTTIKIAIAGFMHDIGKFAELGLQVSEDFLNGNAGLYQPFFEGRHTHRHAVYTAAFIDHIEKLLPPVFNKAQWGLEDSFINLAAGHHLPQTPMQWLIAMADRINSGWDRKGFEEYNKAVAWQDYQKTRLLSLFEGLLKDNCKHACCYPLKPLSPVSIFPGLKKEIELDKAEAAREEYSALFVQFIFDLERLLHKNENVSLWFEHFDSLMMIYTSCIPAARAGKVHPDVSLYDHSKGTSALATALYLYHREMGTLNVDAVRADDEKKFLIITGDFHGIQSFIFSEDGEAGRNRSKLLRGRSFAVSLFSELAADMLLKEIGLACTSVVLNAAGKFTIIAPNTPSAKKAVQSCEEAVNDWLMRISYGGLSMGFASIEASPLDFTSGRFSELWDRLVTIAERKKLSKIPLNKLGVVSTYLDGFRNDLAHPLCPSCGRRPSEPILEGDEITGDRGSICRICRDHIFLGKHLVKESRLAITTTDAEIKGDNKLMEPIFGRYQVSFMGGGLKDMARTGKLLKYYDIATDQDGTVARDVTTKFINGYVPIYTEDDLNDERYLEGAGSEERKLGRLEMEINAPRSFEHIACKAINNDGNGGYRGIQALGILKADVDELGYLMSCGIREDNFTISRLATLSRQLNMFFTLYLPHLLKSDKENGFSDVYTVFAGGDDLFLIGPWNTMIRLAAVLRERFAEYVCNNPGVHFSAGISLHKSHTPIARLAESAEASLEKSKSNKDAKSGRSKDSVTIFSETMFWEEFLKLIEVRGRIEQWKKEGLVNNAMLYRLNEFIQMADRESDIRDAGEATLDDMECLKWRALFSYSTDRNVGKGLKDDLKEDAIREFSCSAQWLEEYGSNLKIALWDVLYNNR